MVATRSLALFGLLLATACAIDASDPSSEFETSEPLTQAQAAQLLALTRATVDAGQGRCLLASLEVGPYENGGSRSSDSTLSLTPDQNQTFVIGGCAETETAPREPNANPTSYLAVLAQTEQTARGVVSAAAGLYTAIRNPQDQPTLEFTSAAPIQTDVTLPFDGYEHGQVIAARADLELERAREALTALSPADFAGFAPAQKNLVYLELSAIARRAGEAANRANLTRTTLEAGAGHFERVPKLCTSLFLPYPCFDDVWVPAS